MAPRMCLVTPEVGRGFDAARGVVVPHNLTSMVRPAEDYRQATPNGHGLSVPPNASSVVVVGLGYVGLPTALSLTIGCAVRGLDLDGQRLDAIRRRRVDLLPEDLDHLGAALADGRFNLTDNPDVLDDADAVLICVPTPVDDHLAPDLTALRLACDAVVSHARASQTIVLTSTTFVGATRALLAEPLKDRGFEIGRDIYVAFSPERLDPGRPDHPRNRTPRVLGGITTECETRARDLVARLTDAEVHVVSSPEAAELAKLHENTFRAVNLALANELAEICSALSLDPIEVIDAAATKPYGFLAHYPGPGVGGHCIPCAPHYLLWQLRACQVATPIIEQAMARIAGRPQRVVERAAEVLSEHGRSVAGVRLAVAGAAYKPGVADLRGSTALEIIARLRGRGADVAYWDPLIPTLRLPDGHVLTSVTSPRGQDYDLVLVHTVLPAGETAWVYDCPIVVDATYRFNGEPHRNVHVV
jgi:UDP-N-acetyl-D-glucosamine dehydrogenase